MGVYSIMDRGIRETFKLNLKKARETRGLTQRAVAEKLEVEPRYYQKIEYGEVWPSPEYIKRLCEAIGCTESELFQNESIAPTQQPIDYKYIKDALMEAAKEFTAEKNAHSLPRDLLDMLASLDKEQLGTVESFVRKVFNKSAKPLKRRKGLD